MSTSGHVYDDFVRLLFLHAHREASILAGELPGESEQFRFWRAARLVNIKGSVGSILAKVSTIEGYFTSICLHGLSYLYLAFFTLVEYLLFLTHFWSYFLINLPEEVHDVCSWRLKLLFIMNR